MAPLPSKFITPVSVLRLKVKSPDVPVMISAEILAQQRAATNNVNSFLIIKSLIRVGRNFKKNYNGTFLFAAAKIIHFFGMGKKIWVFYFIWRKNTLNICVCVFFVVYFGTLPWLRQFPRMYSRTLRDIHNRYFLAGTMCLHFLPQNSPFLCKHKRLICASKSNNILLFRLKK